MIKNVHYAIISLRRRKNLVIASTFDWSHTKVKFYNYKIKFTEVILSQENKERSLLERIFAVSVVDVLSSAETVTKVNPAQEDQLALNTRYIE